MNTPTSPAPNTQVSTTSLGSPCSPAWDEPWIKTINQVESKLGRRICGARTPGGAPCELAPEHKNGRCRFHGGFNLSGAQPGNRNAVIHGLYSRALQRCSPKCPNWANCPLAMPQVAELSPANAPTCPYEATQYQAALTDAVEFTTHLENATNLDHHTAHTMAMLQVMMTRAATTLSNSSLIDATETLTKDPNQRNLKTLRRPHRISPHLLRIPPIPRPIQQTSHKNTLLQRIPNLCPEPAPRLHPHPQKTRHTSILTKTTPSLQNTYLDDILRYAQQCAPRNDKQYTDFITDLYQQAFTLAPELLPQCLQDPKHAPFLNHYPAAQTPL